MSQVTRVAGADEPLTLEVVLAHSGLDIENISSGPPPGQSCHSVLEVGCTVKEKVLKDKK